MKIKRKTQALSYLFETEPPHDEHGIHSALVHSPSTHNRAEGVRGRRFRLEIQKWSLNFMRSRDEVMQTKRHTFIAFHTSESIEGLKGERNLRSPSPQSPRYRPPS